MTARRLFIAFAALVAIGPFVLPPFYVTLLNYIGLYALATLGVVLLTGIAGLVSFGQAAFAGIGAYTTAFLCTNGASLPRSLAWLGASPWVTLLAGLALTFALACVVGALTLSLSGHFLPLGTIAWGLSLYFAFGAIASLGGNTGIADIPPVTIAGFSLRDGGRMYYLIWVFLLVAAVCVSNLLDSRQGRAIRALKGGRVMAEAMGVNTTHMRMAVFILAALMASASGWLYAHMQQFINPVPFGIQSGIDYVFMAVIGGSANVWGALFGAGIFTVVQQVLQDWLPRLLDRTGNFEIIVFGFGMIGVLHVARGGLWPLVMRRVPAAWRAPHATRVNRDAPALPRRPMPNPGEVLLDVRALTRRFGGLVANDAVSLKVKSGEIVALLGPNGAGKSTLFNQISGVDTPSSGDVLFRGERVTGMGSRRIAERGMSRTFQHVRLMSRMSVLDNVAIGAHLRGRGGVLRCALRAERGEEAALLAEAATQIERVGLAAHLHAAAGSLALGQQRVLEIARALASDPCLLLLDEPAAGLRYQEKRDLAALLNRLRAEGLAILLVEHDMEFVMNLVDRVVVMDFGKKIAEGLPADVRAHPAVLAAYLGEEA